MNEEQTIREKLRAFITRDLIRDESYNLRDDEGIVTGGLMDSFSLAEFGVYVEDEFNIYIPDSDLTVEKLDTLNQMVARIQRDLGS
ncbi:MAG: acyl carrier protein [Chloroflexi bacterium]|nr:acyl carrier protein [Chloroflexota bacterium]MBP7043851.1 acyl carrier protein [Chloroflexota bacterium]